MEPGLSREFGPLYGRFRLEGYEAPSVMGRRKPLVVLAELDDSVAELADLLGASNGYDVRRTDDGERAVDLIRALDPNLLVLSLRLPGMDGLEVIRRVRRHPDPLVQRIPILVMDVQHGEQAVMSAFRSGADDYLSMPYDLPVMLRSWRRVAAACLRPAPLTALLNEDAMVRQVALTFLLRRRPDGLVGGLGELLWQPDPTVRAAVRWALKRLGTPDAQAMLDRETARYRGIDDG